MENNQYVSIKNQIAELMGFLKSTEDFKVHHAVTEGIKMMATAVKDGNIDSAIKAGIEVLNAGRNVLFAFLRNSVLDQEEKVGKPAKIARFTHEIRQRVNHQDGPYDGDIIARLEKSRDVLIEAMNTEKGNVFTARIEAYNAMCLALREADAKQKQLDRTRAETLRQRVRTGEVLKDRSKTTKPIMVRAENIAKREEEANELLALI